MDIKSALIKIYAMHQFTIKLGLERIENLLDHLDNPHKNFNSFHIAGSNGKGSTASFLASILMEAGFRVGLYTSPHFVRFNERIRVNGQEIEDSYIADFVGSLEKYIDKYEPTFFEVTTALAFKYFSEADLDFAVIETGLGGRLDATNVIKPLASIITSISLEHTHILGDTIEKIAVEKAGIIKSNSVVLSGLMHEDAEDIISAKALGNGCQHIKAHDFLLLEEQSIIVNLRNKNFRLYDTPLKGYHQLVNSALALKAVNEVTGIDDSEIISMGINRVLTNSGIQGRYEILNFKPAIIYDSAHNPDGVKTFIAEFSKEYKNYSECNLIFGAMRDKNISEMLKLLNPYFGKIYVTQVNIERAATIDEIIEQIPEFQEKMIPLTNPGDFVNKFYSEEVRKCLVILGSMYLLGEIKSKIINKKT